MMASLTMADTGEGLWPPHDILFDHPVARIWDELQQLRASLREKEPQRILTEKMTELAHSAGFSVMERAIGRHGGSLLYLCASERGTVMRMEAAQWRG